MLYALIAILGGLLLLAWSASRFIDGAAASARHLGMPPLLIGMVVVGFGTSAPEMVVSAMAAADDSPALALGNALGSNIFNIGLILGVTSVLAPISVQSRVVRRELPLLLMIGLFVGAMLWDLTLTRLEAVFLLVVFIALMAWTIVSGMRQKGDSLEADIEQQLQQNEMALGPALTCLVAGLLLLVLSSRVLVWGAVTVAEALGVSDLIIGLTIVALGTSLPELAASLIAVRKGEHELAIGNVVGSNMFNLLAVVGIAGLITPMQGLAVEVLHRDWMVMMLMTVAMAAMAYGLRDIGRLNRLEGVTLLLAFVSYNAWLVLGSISTGA